MLFYYHVSFSLKSEFELEKLQKQSISIQKKIYTWTSIIRFSMTNVNRFKLSMTHSNQNMSRTSRRLKKSAQFVKAFIQNNFSTFKLSRNNSKTATSTDLFSNSNIKRQNIKNFFKSWSNDDFNQNWKITSMRYIFRSKNDTIAKSNECNIIQNQNDKKFTFDKINKKSVKIYCIVDISTTWAVNTTNKIVLEFHEIHIVSTKKVLTLQKSILKKTTIERFDHFRSSSHCIVKISINNKQQQRRVFRDEHCWYYHQKLSQEVLYDWLQ